MMISFDQLRMEVDKRTQNYFNPTEIELDSIKRFDEIKKLFYCISCNQIPIEMEICQKCDEIVCIPCRNKILNMSKRDSNQKRCPFPECPDPKAFLFKKF